MADTTPVREVQRLSYDDARPITLIGKINELVIAVNNLAHGRNHYDPQAEEALRQVAILEHTFGEHTHQLANAYSDTPPYTSGPIIATNDDRETNT